jgi:hypothetical protein
MRFSTHSVSLLPRVGLLTACLLLTFFAVYAQSSGLFVFDNQDARGNPALGDWSPATTKRTVRRIRWRQGSPCSQRGHAPMCFCAGHSNTPVTCAGMSPLRRARTVETPQRGIGIMATIKGNVPQTSMWRGPASRPMASSSHSSAVRSHSRAQGGQSCKALAVGSGEAREANVPTGGIDWDYGYYKGECGSGRYIAGASRSVTDGRPHAILCCDIQYRK